MLDPARLLVQTGEWHPECLLYFERIQPKGIAPLDDERMRRDHQFGTDPRIALQIIDVPEIVGRPEFESHFLEGFAARYFQARAVRRIAPAARKCHVPRPRISLSKRAFDQEHLRAGLALAKHDRHRGLLGGRCLDALWLVSSQRSLHMFEFHARRVAAQRSDAGRAAAGAALWRAPRMGLERRLLVDRARLRRMELSREFIPEARRLLKLARSDRKAAERELDSLPPEQQAAVLVEAPLSIRRNLFDLLKDPEAVVPHIPEAELVYTCRSIGLADSNWLLPMATPTQLVACFDLDAWEGLRVSPARLDEWMAALVASEEDTILRAAQAMDPELLVIYLRNHIDVYMKPSEQEDPDWSPPDLSQTLEGQFYFVAKNPKDDLGPLLGLLHSLFSGDYWLYFRAIQAVHQESQIENEEWALRWRTGRLEDLGFPSWDTAMRIYGFLRPDRRGDLPEDETALDIEGGALPIAASDLPGSPSGERALFRAARELDADERAALFYALIHLANRIAVADRMELGDAESLPKAIEKATRFASDGLEHVAEKNGVSHEAALRRARLERLFRVGVNLDPEAALPPPLEADGDEESGNGREEESRP